MHVDLTAPTDLEDALQAGLLLPIGQALQLACESMLEQSERSSERLRSAEEVRPGHMLLASARAEMKHLLHTSWLHAARDCMRRRQRQLCCVP